MTRQIVPGRRELEDRHQAVDHQTGKNSNRCSMDGCDCPRTKDGVKRDNPAVEVPVFAGYNRETGRWG